MHEEPWISCPQCGSVLKDWVIDAMHQGSSFVGSGGIVCPNCGRRINHAEIAARIRTTTARPGTSKGRRKILYCCVIVLIATIMLYYFGARPFLEKRVVVQGIPIEIVVADGIAVQSVSADICEVEFVASGEGFDPAAYNTVVFVDMRSLLTSGEMHIRLTPDMVRGGRPGKPKRIRPTQLVVHLDRAESKTVPIVPRVVDTPLVGHVSRIAVDPPNALIFGPAEIIAAVSNIPTERISLEGRVLSFRHLARLDAAPSSGVARIEPKSVTVSISIEAEAQRPADRNPDRGDGLGL